jgi:nucleotidyltransferase substrate binding protein (TIGR01987 family)
MNKAVLLADFGQALDRFEESLLRPVSDDLLRAGCIQYFEFTFELAWKTVKAHAEDAGLGDVGSPRSALRQAFKQGWIVEEEGWLAMLEARNRLAHTYQASHALAIYGQLPEFSQQLRRLHAVLSREKG